MRSLLLRVRAIEALLPEGLCVASAARRFLIFREDVDFVVCGVNKARHIEDLVSDCAAGPLDEDLVAQLLALHNDNFGLPESERSLGY